VTLSSLAICGNRPIGKNSLVTATKMAADSSSRDDQGSRTRSA